MTPDLKSDARSLGEFIDSAPSPYHAVESAVRMLSEAGFSQLGEAEKWSGGGKRYVVRGGSLVAWSEEPGCSAGRGFRVVGAHTDSPNLRIKPRPDTGRAGYRQLGVEIYGGVLLNSWLDRDLGLSGRVQLRNGSAPAGLEERLFCIGRPILRVPQLAIHLHRDINEKGLKLNPQRHMAPIWGLADGSERGFTDWLGSELGVPARDIASWDAMCHDTMPSAVTGVDEEFLSAPRLDNLCSSYTGLRALIDGPSDSSEQQFTPVLCLFDHEEVGSSSRGGAGGPILRDVLERIVLLRGGSREDYHRSITASLCASADMAHATHPNYVEKHEPDHILKMNAGPVIKINTNLRYASESETEAHFQLACEAAGVPFQKWVNRTDLACGSTIGPITAANLGMKVVDVGCAQLAMHSVREFCGSHDPGYMIQALRAFFA